MTGNHGAEWLYLPQISCALAECAAGAMTKAFEEQCVG